MFNLPLALTIALLTLFAVGLIFLTIMRISRKLADDPELQEFIQHVEEGKAAQSAEKPSQMKEPPR